MEWRWDPPPHLVPEDDFAHVESMECPCGPQLHALPWYGGAICHRAVRAEPLPDTVPAAWESR